jgi:hypothetical protein
MLDALGRFILWIFGFSATMHIVTNYTIFAEWLNK